MFHLGAKCYNFVLEFMFQNVLRKRGCWYENISNLTQATTNTSSTYKWKIIRRKSQVATIQSFTLEIIWKSTKMLQLDCFKINNLVSSWTSSLSNGKTSRPSFLCKSVVVLYQAMLGSALAWWILSWIGFVFNFWIF